MHSDLLFYFGITLPNCNLHVLRRLGKYAGVDVKQRIGDYAGLQYRSFHELIFKTFAVLEKYNEIANKSNDYYLHYDEREPGEVSDDGGSIGDRDGDGDSIDQDFIDEMYGYRDGVSINDDDEYDEYY
jgi:hypothetical protein